MSLSPTAQTRAAPTGFAQGMLDMTRAAAAPFSAITSGSPSLSRDRRLHMIWREKGGLVVQGEGLVAGRGGADDGNGQIARRGRG